MQILEDGMEQKIFHNVLLLHNKLKHKILEIESVCIDEFEQRARRIHISSLLENVE